ncbi:MAG: nucleotidyltransferase domain-containing protein [Deltaproteobacteria bacterium]|nr:nucleotidyltransferase domain-containing protein [Deltaproteobacteria bacterium]
MLLFGSLTRGTPTPRSDADLLVEVAASVHPTPRDRIPDVLRALSPLPCPVDLFVFTSAEVERLREDGSPLVRVALEEGVDLLA